MDTFGHTHKILFFSSGCQCGGAATVWRRQISLFVRFPLGEEHNFFFKDSAVINKFKFQFVQNLFSIINYQYQVKYNLERINFVLKRKSCNWDLKIPLKFIVINYSSYCSTVSPQRIVIENAPSVLIANIRQSTANLHNLVIAELSGL